MTRWLATLSTTRRPRSPPSLPQAAGGGGYGGCLDHLAPVDGAGRQHHLGEALQHRLSPTHAELHRPHGVAPNVEGRAIRPSPHLRPERTQPGMSSPPRAR